MFSLFCITIKLCMCIKRGTYGGYQDENIEDMKYIYEISLYVQCSR